MYRCIGILYRSPLLPRYPLFLMKVNNLLSPISKPFWVMIFASSPIKQEDLLLDGPSEPGAVHGIVTVELDIAENFYRP